MTLVPNPEQVARYGASPPAFFADLRILAGGSVRRFGDVAVPFQLAWLESIAPSLLAIGRGESPPCGRFWIEAVKSAAKSMLLAMIVCWLLAFATVPQAIQVAASDADQADEIRKWVKLLLLWSPWLASRIEVQNWKVVCRQTNSEAEILSSDIAGSHGARPTLLIIDEIHAITKWEFVQNLLDNAAKVDGAVVVTTNAGFCDSEAFRLREIARQSDRWTFHSLQEPPPWVSESELSEARIRNSAARYDRLWRCIWQQGSEDGIRPELIADAFRVPLLPIDAGKPAERYVAGLDLSRVHDHSALAIVRKTSAGRVQLVHLKTWRPARGCEIDYGDVEACVADAYRRFRWTEARADATQAAKLCQDLAAKSVPIVAEQQTTVTVRGQSSAIFELLSARLIDLGAFRSILEPQLFAARIVETPSGFTIKLGYTDGGGHSDALAAVMLAVGVAKNLQVISFWNPPPPAGGLERTASIGGPRWSHATFTPGPRF